MHISVDSIKLKIKLPCFNCFLDKELFYNGYFRNIDNDQEIQEIPDGIIRIITGVYDPGKIKLIMSMIQFNKT